MQKLRIARVGMIPGGRAALAADSPRPPISRYRIVARAHMYTHAAKLWDLSLVQDHFLSPRVRNPDIDSQFLFLIHRRHTRI
jgi:hypothetical protein